MARILVTEKLAESGLNLLRDAGHNVDVQLGLSPSELTQAIRGAEALIIRSATDVTAEVFDAADVLRVVGRAGVGLDNVDTDAATAKGVMVANAPTSNSASAAEHTMAMLLAVARNVPQAHRALVDGRWERSAWGGVELLDKTLGIVGLGNIGGMVAQRARSFGMRILGHDPFVSPERAAELGVEMMSLDELVAESDFLTLHLARTPETVGLINANRLALAKPSLRIVNVARGGIIDEADLAVAIESGVIAGAALDVFANEPATESALFTLPQVVVTPHLGASTAEAQDRAGLTIAEQVRLALDNEFVPFAVNVSARGVSETVRPFLPLAEQLGKQFTQLVGGRPGAVDVVFAGEIGGFDCRMAELAVTKGLLAAVADVGVSYVNAEQLADEYGIKVQARTSTKTPSGLVNGIKLEGDGHSIAGTLELPSGDARIVSIDGINVDLAPSEHMVLVMNDDTPGMIGKVGMILGDAGVNIDDMHLARAMSGLALMAISTATELSSEVLASLESLDSILSVKPLGVHS